MGKNKVNPKTQHPGGPQHKAPHLVGDSKIEKLQLRRAKLKEKFLLKKIEKMLEVRVHSMNEWDKI
tara:strand:+ start:96 stop:293 length:198 start_codon:yes stop_codon:yes gene_type:complete